MAISWRAFALAITIALIILAASAIVIVPAVLWTRYVERQKRPGFEVKRNTGPLPVLKEKENDHG